MSLENAELPIAESIFHGVAWTSEKKGRLPRGRSRLVDAYDTNEAWQEYLHTYRPSDMRVIVEFDDTQSLKIRYRNSPEGPNVFVDVPSDEFRNGADAVATYGSVVERIYTWIAERFDWPPPPPPITQ